MKPIRGTFKSTIAKGEGEQEVEVHYQCFSGTSDVRTLRNGDPGYPGDPAEVEILSVTEIYPAQYIHLGQHNILELLSDEEVERLCDEAIADAESKREVEVEHDHGGEA